MAKLWRTPPAELYKIRDEFAAYCFNRAVMLFGTTMEADLEKAGEKAKSTKSAEFKRQRVFDKWMHMPGEPTKGRFKDPAKRQLNPAPQQKELPPGKG